MPDSEMVERVAKAIYDATDPLSGDHIATVIVASEHLFPGRQHTEGNSSSKAYQLAAMDVCRAAARAAIEAMMEPTEAMMNAAPAVGAEAFRVIWPKICGDVWRTMAAEALSPSLKEQEEGN